MAAPRAPLRVGVAGVGRMGLRHVEAVLRREDVTLSAVADPSPGALDRARELALAGDIDKPQSEYATAEQMLSLADLDCVIVATPPQMHAAHCVMALGRRTAVLVEKPLAASLEDGQAIVDESCTSRVLLTVGHIERFNPVVEVLREHVRGGLVGPLLAIETWRHGPQPDPRHTEGVALDLAVHDLDLLHHVFGEHPVAVETRPHIELSIDDRLDAELKMSSGVSALLSVGWDKQRRERGVAVRGELGVIEVDLVNQKLRYMLGASADGNFAGWQSQSFPGEPLVREHDAFFEAVWNGGPAPVSGHDALRALFEAHALLRSAALGSPVPLPSPVAA
jgi:UDP-N-acetylglucosamine 3-dehydrogenase